MRFLFIAASVFIAVVYYVGIRSDTDNMTKQINNTMKFINIMSGRDATGNFTPYPAVGTMVITEEDDPSTYYVPEIPKESEHDWRYNA